MAPEYGVTAATFAIARTLKERGHRIVYLTSATLAPIIQKTGFEALITDDSPRHVSPQTMNGGEAIGFLSKIESILARVSAARRLPGPLRVCCERWSCTTRDARLRVSQTR